MPRANALLTTAAGILLLSVASPAAAQQSPDPDDIPVVTRTIAIQGARIVQAPGQVIEHGTLVMRDGLITEVGTEVAIPYDAEVIRGDSLTVYAGFIDGLSHVGIPERSASQDENGDDEEPVNAADPTDERAGIQPDRTVRDLLDPTDKNIALLRALGFTAAHVVPRGRMLPGTGAIVLLSNEERSEMVLQPDVSLFMQFVGGAGVYPATPMGIMAKLRQLVRESERRKRIEILYAENPAGLERPTFDPVHEAFYPVLSREKPVFVWTSGDDGALQVHRALQLREELGFSLALGGLNQGFEVVDDLKEAGVPLFLTLALPESPEDASSDTTAADTTAADPESPPEEATEEDTSKTMTPEEASRFFISDLHTRSYEDVEREEKNLKARQVLERQKYYGTAASFNEAGLRFGVASLGADPKDIRKNICRMVEAGLSEDAALAALTIDGARLLGVERSLGTVEAGKVANLVVTKGSYFDPESPVRFVFVDGWKYKIDEEDEEGKGKENG